MLLLMPTVWKKYSKIFSRFSFHCNPREKLSDPFALLTFPQLWAELRVTSEAVRCGAVERERHYTLKVYWRDGAGLHSSGLLEHQWWLGSDWYGSRVALPHLPSASFGVPYLSTSRCSRSNQTTIKSNPSSESYEYC